MKYRVIKDTREKYGWDFQEDLNCAGTTIEQLDTGDYSIVGSVLKLSIERKGCISEFVTNLVDKRFDNEMQRLNEFKFAYLLLEFEMSDILRYPQGSTIPKHKWSSIKMKPEFIMSLLLSLQHKYPNVKILFVGKCGKEVAKTIFRKVAKYVNKDIPTN